MDRIALATCGPSHVDGCGAPVSLGVDLPTWTVTALISQLRRAAALMRAEAARVAWATRPCAQCHVVTTVDVMRDGTSLDLAQSDPERCDLVCPDCWEEICRAEEAADALEDSDCHGAW